MARYLVTSALPYANGPIHFGQVVGAYLPADCYVRCLRMLGEEVCFVCGADEYGVAITINAEAEDTPYPEYVRRWRERAKATFDQLGIEFDVWSGTSVSPCHAETAQEFFRQLDKNGYLLRREDEQWFCPRDERFLADRYVTGVCPQCGASGARGDECPSCGAYLDALDLGSPRCKVCGAEPEKRSTLHWYLDLPRLRDEHIGEWFRSRRWKANVQAFVGRMLEELRPRPITRDMDWGVPVPPDVAGEIEGKVLYVWFDAPIGYISFTREWARARGDPEAWRSFWQDPETRIVHFIGKDNIPFHCQVFPSMLFGVKQGYSLPWQVPAMEFYNLQGRKFSTSGDWTIPPDEIFRRFDAEAVRFYLLFSTPETADSEWRWEDFQACVNGLLADKIGNLVTRVLRFVAKRCDGRIPALDPRHEEELDRLLLSECGPIEDPAAALREFRFRRGAEALIGAAAAGNVFIDRSAPWKLIGEDPELARSTLNTACEWIALLARWMVPFMPSRAEEIREMLGSGGQAEDVWPDAPRPGSWRTLEVGRPLGEIRPPFRKVEDAEIEAELKALRARSAAPS